MIETLWREIRALGRWRGDSEKLKSEKEKEKRKREMPTAALARLVPVGGAGKWPNEER